MQRFIALGVLGLLACSRAERRTDVDSGTSPDGSMTQMDAPDDNPNVDGSIDSQQTTSGMCGNGTMNAGEACDDNNMANGDGCSSTCALEPTQTVTVMGLSLAIPDNGYDGTRAATSMACASVPVTAWYTPAIASMTVTVGITHSWVGDLTIKIVHPDNTVVTLMSRPGVAEPADDGGAASGLGSTGLLSPLYPPTFATGAATSAEQMGVGGGTVCINDANNCRFAPANGAAAAGTLASFNGKTSTGTWMLCAGDSNSIDTGTINRVTLTFEH